MSFLRTATVDAAKAFRTGDLVAIRWPEDIHKLVLWNDSFNVYTGYMDPADVGIILCFQRGYFSGVIYAFVVGPNGMGLASEAHLVAV